jgi:hypothetical protein
VELFWALKHFYRVASHPTGWKVLAGNDIAYLDEVAETILPATKTPGAKAAKVGEFMTVIVNDCYEEKDQKIFMEGMDKLNEASKKKNSKTFMESTPEQRHDLLVALTRKPKTTRNQKRKKIQTIISA